MKTIYLTEKYIISLVIILFPLLLCNCYSQIDPIKQDTVIINLINVRGIIQVPILNPVIKPHGISIDHKAIIKRANYYACCLTKALTERINVIWNNASKKEILIAWDTLKWNGEPFFYERFGKAQKYRHINKVKKHVERSLNWITNDKVTYKEKQIEGPLKEDTNAAAIPFPPRKVKLYNDFFRLNNPMFQGAIIVHELVHEDWIVGHPAMKYKTNSNTMEDATLKLAEKEPKNAKRAPYVYMEAVLSMDVTCK